MTTIINGIVMMNMRQLENILAKGFDGWVQLNILSKKYPEKDKWFYKNNVYPIVKSLTTPFLNTVEKNNPDESWSGMNEASASHRVYRMIIDGELDKEIKDEEITMKKNCNGCRASDNRMMNHCSLNYKIKSILKRSTMGNYYIDIPLEECPKPKTYKDYLSERDKLYP